MGLNSFYKNMLVLSVFSYTAFFVQKITINAAVIDKYVDFDNMIVSNFDDYDRNITSSTSGLTIRRTASILLTYSMSGFDTGDWSGTFTAIDGSMVNQYPITLPFSSTNNQVFFSNSVILDSTYIDRLVYDDSLNNTLTVRFDINWGTPTYNKVLTYTATIDYTLEYRFNTAYLWDTIQLDLDLGTPSVSGTAGSGVVSSYAINPYLVYVTNYSDQYNIYNNNLKQNYSQPRSKYAITTGDNDYIVGLGLGAGNNFIISGTMTSPAAGTGTYRRVQVNSSIYYLNFSRESIGLPTAPSAVNPKYSECDDSVFGFPVDCTINGEEVNSFQALANDAVEYITKDAPLVSDAIRIVGNGYDLITAGFYMVSDIFTGNIFGTMMLFGVGLLVIDWGINKL